MINIPTIERIKGVVGDRIVFHSDTNDYSILLSDIERLTIIINVEKDKPNDNYDKV
jgi:hypothetical protein